MERNEWINAQVRGEIEDLQRRFGLAEDEALARWHLQKVGELMNDMRHADVLEKIDRDEYPGEQAIDQTVGLISDVALWHTRVSQHLTALSRELGQRVLRRAYPEGWGNVTDDEGDED